MILAQREGLGLGVYLRHYQLLPYQRIGELLADLFGAGPAAGTLHRASLTCAAALGAVEAAIKTALGAAAVAHADETSIVVAGRRRWVHVVSTGRLTQYAWHAKRGHAATDAIGILPAFRGRLIHDAWAPYWHYGCRHGLCNAHHLRELAAVAEQAGQAWAAQLRALLIELHRHVAAGRATGLTSSPPATREDAVTRYRALLA
ncbi:MAG: transposase, partial [Chloroflexota bacterium]|nr:transposase [Chloroflexota bacterium]